MKFKCVNGRHREKERRSQNHRRRCQANVETEKSCELTPEPQISRNTNQLKWRYFCLVGWLLVCWHLCACMCTEAASAAEISFIQCVLNDKNHFKIDIRHRQNRNDWFYIYRWVVKWQVTERRKKKNREK